MQKGMNVQGYISAKIIADIALLLKNKDIDVEGNMSRLVGVVFDNFHQQLCKVKFDNNELAISFLKEEGFSLKQIKVKDLRHKHLIEGLSEESLRGEEVDSSIKERATKIADMLDRDV